MANKLQWYDDKTANWITLDPAKHPALDPKEKYRIFEAGRVNVTFSGDKWDPSILDNPQNLGYWAGYHGAKILPVAMDADSYHDGRMDFRNQSDNTSDEYENLKLYFNDEDDEFGR